eukprot:6496842-Pyramimonas_sp.AAC.1
MRCCLLWVWPIGGTADQRLAQPVSSGRGSPEGPGAHDGVSEETTRTCEAGAPFFSIRPPSVSLSGGGPTLFVSSALLLAKTGRCDLCTYVLSLSFMRGLGLPLSA